MTILFMIKVIVVILLFKAAQKWLMLLDNFINVWYNLIIYYWYFVIPGTLKFFTGKMQPC